MNFSTMLSNAITPVPVKKGFFSILKQNKGTTGLHWRMVGGKRVYIGMNAKQLADLHNAAFNRGVQYEHGRVTGEGGGSSTNHNAAVQEARQHHSEDTVNQVSTEAMMQGRAAFRNFHTDNPHAADGMSRSEIVSAVRDHTGDKPVSSDSAHTPTAAPTPAAAAPARPTPPAAPTPTPADIAKAKQLHENYVTHRVDGVRVNLAQGISMPTSAMVASPASTAKLQAIHDHALATTGNQSKADAAVSAAAHDAHQTGLALVNNYNQDKTQSLHTGYVNNHVDKVKEDLASGGNGAILQGSDQHLASLAALHKHVKETTGSNELAEQATTRAKDAAHEAATVAISSHAAQAAAHEALHGLAPESSVRDAVNGMSNAQQHNYLVEHEARTAANPPTARHTQLYNAIKDRHAKEAAHKAAHDKLVQEHVDGILAKHSSGARHIDSTDMAHIPRIGMRVNAVGDAAQAANKDPAEARRAVVREAKEKAHAALAHARATTAAIPTPTPVPPAVAPATPEPAPTGDLHATNYINTTNGHNKFWKISVQGKHTVVHHGAIGTRGRVLVKEHAGVASARAYALVLSSAKRGDGYVSTGASTISREAAHAQGLPHEAVVSAVTPAATPSQVSPSQAHPAAVLPSQQREATAARHDALVANLHQTARALGAVHDPDPMRNNDSDPALSAARDANHVAREAAIQGGVSTARLNTAHDDGYAAGQAVRAATAAQIAHARSEADRLVEANRVHAEAMTAQHAAQQAAAQAPVTPAAPEHPSHEDIQPIHRALTDYDYRYLQTKSQVAKALHDGAYDLKKAIARHTSSPSEYTRDAVAKVKGSLEALKLYAHNNPHIIKPRDAAAAIVSGTKATHYGQSPQARRLNRGTAAPNQVRNPTIENSAAATPEVLRTPTPPVPATATTNRGATGSPLEKAENELREAVHQRGRNMAQYEHDRQAPNHYAELRTKIDGLKTKVARLSDETHAKKLEDEGLAKGKAERQAEIALEKIHGQKITALTNAAHALGKHEGYDGGVTGFPASSEDVARMKATHEAALSAVKEAVGEAKAKELHEAAHARGVSDGKALREVERQTHISHLSDAIHATAREQGRLSVTGQSLPPSTLAGHAANKASLSALTNESRVRNLHDDAHEEGKDMGQKELTNALAKASQVIGYHAGKNTEPTHAERLAVETAHAKVKQHIGLDKANAVAAKAHAEGKAEALNPDMTDEKVKKHMKDLGLGSKATPEFCKAWTKHMPKISPTEFMHSFFSEANSDPQNLAHLRLDFNGASLYMSAEPIKLHGSTATRLVRNFNFDTKTVEHSFLTIAEADQSKGGVKKMFKALMSKGADGKCVYQRMGMNKAHVHGALGGGGYTWPSFGFFYDNQRQQDYHQDQIKGTYNRQINNTVGDPSSFSKVKAYVDNNNIKLPNSDGTFAVRPFTAEDHAQYLQEHKAVIRNLESKGDMSSGYQLTKMNTSMLNAVNSVAIHRAIGDEKRPTLAKLLMRGSDMYGNIDFTNEAQMPPIRAHLNKE